MDSKNREIYDSVINQSLEKNMKLIVTWSRYKNDINTVKYLLNTIPKKVTTNVMVPIGPKALMPGKLVHTNEYLVNLGETWFVKRSAHQTIEICNRRMKNCVEMLEKLEKERELIVNKNTLPFEQEAFCNDERFEIIEYMPEEEYQKYKGTRRSHIKDQHKKQSVDIRMEQKEPDVTYLDEIELKEFENELNELNSEFKIKDAFNEVLQSNSSFVEIEKIPPDMKKEDIKENVINENKTIKNENLKKKVTFECDSDSSDNEPLRLEIKHTEENFSCLPNNGEINSPADIYNNFKKLIKEKPVSVLKPSIRRNNNDNNSINYSNLDLVSNVVELNNEEENFEDNFPISHGVLLHDISEKSVCSINNAQTVEVSKTKKISKFKASRKRIH